MLLQIMKPDTGACINYVWADDGGFDLRNVRWSREGDVLTGTVTAPDDSQWTVSTATASACEEYARDAIKLHFQIRAAHWNYRRGVIPTDEQVADYRKKLAASGSAA